jgi:predicted Zn-dependent protease
MHGTVPAPSPTRTTRTTIAATIAALTGALVAGACSTTSGPLGAAEQKVADIVVPVSEENQLGQQMEQQLAQQQKLLQNDQVTGYIRQLGEAVVAAVPDEVPAGIQVRFDVIDDDQTVNAFAIPGGHIYVYSGLLRMASNEAEVVGVLGHELAHVTNRHIARALTAQYGVKTLEAIAFGQEPGLLGQLVTNVAAQGFLLKYTRDEERQADHDGIAYEAKAGWDPHGFVTFFQKLEQQGGSSMPVFLQTHPAPDERIGNAEDRIQELGQVPSRLGAQRYQQQCLQPLGARAK